MQRGQLAEARAALQEIRGPLVDVEEEFANILEAAGIEDGRGQVETVGVVGLFAGVLTFSGGSGRPLKTSEFVAVSVCCGGASVNLQACSILLCLVHTSCPDHRPLFSARLAVSLPLLLRLPPQQHQHRHHQHHRHHQSPLSQFRTLVQPHQLPPLLILLVMTAMREYTGMLRQWQQTPLALNWLVGMCVLVLYDTRVGCVQLNKWRIPGSLSCLHLHNHTPQPIISPQVLTSS